MPSSSSTSDHHKQIEEAYAAAEAFIERWGILAALARGYQPQTKKPKAWQEAAASYGFAFIAWSDLTGLLIPEVRTAARSVYAPGAPVIKLGKGKAKPTVIEAVADELGIYFRNTVYAGRRHPLEPDIERLTIEAKARAMARQGGKRKRAEPMGSGADLKELLSKETRAVVRERLGLKNQDDVLKLMAREWKAQSKTQGESALNLLRCEAIDFDELGTQLLREERAVVAAASNGDAKGAAASAALLSELRAGIAAITATERGRTEQGQHKQDAIGRGGGLSQEQIAKLPTAADLCADPLISTDTFGRIREDAGIDLGLHGPKARKHRYAPEEVDRLIQAVLAGNYLKRRALAEKWAQWSSKQAANKPHGSK